ncbi:MAG: hypothetical protein ACRD88_06930, partial [Terriglobia bacterium]
PKVYTRPLTDVKVYRLMKDWETYRADWEVIENQTVCLGGYYEDEVPWFGENSKENAEQTRRKGQ